MGTYVPMYVEGVATIFERVKDDGGMFVFCARAQVRDGKIFQRFGPGIPAKHQPRAIALAEALPQLQTAFTDFDLTVHNDYRKLYEPGVLPALAGPPLVILTLYVELCKFFASAERVVSMYEMIPPEDRFDPAQSIPLYGQMYDRMDIKRGLAIIEADQPIFEANKRTSVQDRTAFWDAMFELRVRDGQISSALDALLIAFGMRPTPQRGKGIILLANAVNRHQDVLDVAQKIVKQEPLDPGDVARRGVAEATLGHLDDAENTVQELLALGTPRGTKLGNNLAQLLQKHRKGG